MKDEELATLVAIAAMQGLLAGAHYGPNMQYDLAEQAFKNADAFMDLRRQREAAKK